MKRGRFTEEQIIAVLREAESGTPVKELCRRAGVSTVTFYKWKSKYTRTWKSAKCVGCVFLRTKMHA